MTKVYFFSVWEDFPQSCEPRLFYVTEQQIVTKHGVEPDEFIDQVIHLDPRRFVAFEYLENLVPTCLCCHDFGGRHRDMAAMFFWGVQGFGLVKPLGAVTGKDPAPLDSDDVEFVLDQLAVHPRYAQQRVTMVSCENEVVELWGSDIHRTPLQ